VSYNRSTKKRSSKSANESPAMPLSAEFWPPFPVGSVVPAGAHWRSRRWTLGVPLEGGGKYPLKDEWLRRSFSPPNGSWPACSWSRVAAALESGKPARLIVIGGSFTRGHDCGGPDVCAWPLHVAEWLRRIRPQWRATLLNTARGATDSNGWASGDIVAGDAHRRHVNQ
jgi:hypothetical protein